ncbi:RNA polymerase subunit sigma-70 [Prauserella sp. PE36]|uniref:sigma-70 family RNA polymerase sigma factor n=1 Tax=Prauserella sp. PE36 TaxID=1504709 RepID=UPI000D896024|nr:sigma-70 family RNA polymerase sigma factor [Prauserella sp. PE36]PXY33203.1 RNA polymerase subunit sigma-70 [Prauserella coralliicola]RBM16245.1 RNA polymerase subunit sigma-70 [Prauserella sp. PE36]
MRDWDALAELFEGRRDYLWAVAYRILGSATDAEDAVQETWLRLQRADLGEVGNLPGWLTTVVTRICLDLLRSPRRRRETPADPELPDRPGDAADPAREAVLADSVSRALFRVLETLSPAERVALVLHDVFAVPFAEIAPILDRTPQATKRLASRARARVAGGAGEEPVADLAGHRRLVDAFLAAIRAGDTEALLAVLAPDVVRRVDPALLRDGVPAEVRGSATVVAEARTMSAPARTARPALVDGSPGAVVVRDGHVRLALTFRIVGDLIAEFAVIGDPSRLSRLTVTEVG